MIINGGSNALQQNLERIDYYNSAILYTNSYYGVSVSKWCLQASEIECRVITVSANWCCESYAYMCTNTLVKFYTHM